jgi:hypothetical protein
VSCIDDHFVTLEATLDLAAFIRRAELHSLDEFPLAVPFTVAACCPIWARIG